jgi:hypothetical protein
MAPPLSGVRILVSSNGQEVETVTQKDGSFAAFGIPPGRVQIHPVLPPHLTIFNKSALTRELRAGACTQVDLTAAVNGRVRGRVIGASNRSIKDATIHLSSIDITRFRLDPTVHYTSSHAPRLSVRVAEDGSFELLGVPAGTYLLLASVPKLVDGKEIRVTTYYPGSSEQSGATPLEVGEATEHEGFDFVVRLE